ncbi:hypothetical protein VNI00_010601 [Paramarasmius palmivorus]|uniref:Uncharacterized protein n=1 Tax=Paramarasmius palmivorus TaxID=297713 RepID=A0AAW0CGT6_9AGAR
MGSMLFVTRKGDNNYASDGTADGRFFHIYKDLVDGKAKASRIRLATEDKVPKGANIVTLRSDLVDGTPILRAVTYGASAEKDTGYFYVTAVCHNTRIKLSSFGYLRLNVTCGVAKSSRANKKVEKDVLFV